MNSTQLTYQSIIAPYSISLVLSAAILLLTIVPLGFARYSRGFSIKDINAPRELSNQFTSWGKRAEAAHKNSFEAFAIHSPAILLAIITTNQGYQLDELTPFVSLAHPLFRAIYIYAYLSNYSVARAFFWGGGLTCSCLIYIESLKALLFI